MLAWVAREPASGNAVGRSSSSASHLGTHARTSVLSLSLIDFVAWLAQRTFANFLIAVDCHCNTSSLSVIACESQGSCR